MECQDNMHRFLLYKKHLTEKIEIDDVALLHQFFSVLRFKIGDEIIFFDGESNEDCVYILEEIQKKKSLFSRIQTLQKNT
jgi:16S rRNA U1498 N3-methylase RsmE